MTVISCAALLAALGCLFAPPAPAQSGNGSSQKQSLSLDPTFEVATVRPSDPNDHDWGLGTKGNHFFARDATVVDLICFAYEVHAKQIVSGPAWYRTERFDVEGVPDFEGRPVRLQLQSMLQKLLADRFQLKFHTEKQNISVYALVVANGGVKFQESSAPSDARSGYNFPEIMPVTHMKVMRMTMSNFISALQRVVADRPIVDETQLKGRYDFDLIWTPDESQFNQLHGVGVSVTTGKDEANAPPGLFTAIQNQLGLKLEAKKAMIDVIAIDRIEMPSAN
jgi:uncharacterized protein (TIGR03435 family)